MHYVAREGDKFVLGIIVPHLIFWKKTYEFVCDTEDEVRKRIVPYDTMIIVDNSVSYIQPQNEKDTTPMECIWHNINFHTGDVRECNGVPKHVQEVM
jgi:hypothetical protein